MGAFQDAAGHTAFVEAFRAPSDEAAMASLTKGRPAHSAALKTDYSHRTCIVWLIEHIRQEVWPGFGTC